MSAFYFFTEPDKLPVQNQNNAFGPLGASGGFDVFQVSGLHKTAAPLKAFAVCNGTICVQKVGSTGLVNLILKPAQQPECDLPYIGYYLYKGIKASSIWDNSEKILASGPNASELVKMVRKSDGANNGAAPDSKALGAHLTGTTLYDDLLPLDNLFYKGDVNYTLHFVQGGMHLGDFVENNWFGLTIVVERIGYQPAIGLARKIENQIKVPQYTATPPQPNDATYFEHWHKKEEILNFLDPCSFWGSFGEKQLKAWDDTSQKHKLLTYGEVYSKILKGVSGGNFANRNAICVDLRSEHGGSLNYYKNYGNTIQISTDGGSTYTDINYYHSGWPWWCLLTPPSGLVAGQSTVTLNIALPKTDNTLPLVYLSQLPDTAPISDPDRFVAVHRQSFSDYVTPFSIEMPLINDSGLKYRAAIARIMYCRRIDKNVYTNPPTHAPTTLPYKEHLDNVFQPFAMGLPFDRGGKLGIKVYGQEVFVDKTHVDGTLFVGYAGVCEDQDNFTFFVFPVHGASRSDVQSQRGYAKHTAPDNNGTALSFLDYSMKKHGYFFIKHDQTVNGQAVSTYSLLNRDGMQEQPSVLVVNKAKLRTAKTASTSTLLHAFPVRLALSPDADAVVNPPDGMQVLDVVLAGFNGTALVERGNYLTGEKSLNYGDIYSKM